jgi:hypothetical protein
MDMIEIRKVPAAAGARWLLAGLTVWRSAPLRLGQLGMLFGLVVVLGVALSALNPLLGVVLQLLILFAVPVMMGGLIWAVRETEQGRLAHPGHLLQGTRDGRLPHLMMAVLPYFLAGIALGILQLLLIGQDGVARWLEVQAELNRINQAGEQISPEQMYELAATLPVYRTLLWMAISVLTTLAVALMLALMLPQVMFDHRSGWQALAASLRAGLHNLPAMAVFYASVLVSLLALNIAAFVILLVLSLILGPALSLVLILMLYTGTLLPVLAGAVHAAWKDLFSAPATPGLTATPAPPSDVFEA